MRSGDETVSEWARDTDGPPEHMVVCAPLHRDRETDGRRVDYNDGRVDVAPIDPDEVTHLLMLLNRELRSTEEGKAIALYFEGVEEVLTSLSLTGVYRFLIVVIELLDHSRDDVRSEFYLDRTSVDGHEVDSLKNLFDSVER